MSALAKQGTELDTRYLAQWCISGIAMNSSDFAKAFTCPVGNPMDPRKKCGVWLMSVLKTNRQFFLFIYTDLEET